MNKAGELLGIFLSVFSVIFSFAQSSEKSILLNFDAAIEKAKPMKMSDFISSVEYVPLETTENNLFSAFTSVGYVSADYILYKTNVLDSVCAPGYLFDRKGKFLARIGSFGKGPKELIRGISSCRIDTEQGQIALFCGNTHPLSASWYDLSGGWLGEKKVDWADYEAYVCGKGTDLYYSYYLPYFYFTGTTDRVMLIQQFFDSTRVFIGPMERMNDLDRVPELYGTYCVRSTEPKKHAFGHFSVLKNDFYTQYADYVGLYDHENSRYCRFYYDGRTEFPYSVYCTKWNPVSVSDSESNYRQWMFGWLETDRFCFIELGAGTTYRLIYDKQKDKLHALPTDTWGLQDDMCGEEWWWPEGVTEDGLLYVRRSASWLKERAEKSSDAKLKALAASLREDDNDVMIFVTPKK